MAKGCLWLAIILLLCPPLSIVYPIDDFDIRKKPLGGMFILYYYEKWIKYARKL